MHGSNGGIGETCRKATRPDPTHLRRFGHWARLTAGVRGLTKISGQGPNDVHCGAIGLSLQSYQRWNMAILTVEGVVENGQIRLRDNVALPEHTKVYVVIPDVETAPP